MKNDIELLRSIIEFADNISDARRQLGDDIEDYLESPIYQAGCTMFIMQIGESIRKLSDQLKARHPEVDWSGYIGLRNIAAHRYSYLDNERIWRILKIDIPSLRDACISILSEIELK